jgi:hypothetical protein
MRAISARWAFILLVGGCATETTTTPRDPYSVAEMQHGPSIYETGRIAVVPPSKGGLKVDEGAIDRPPRARASSAAVAARPHGKRKSRARAQRLP